MNVFASGWLFASSNFIEAPSRALLTVDQLPPGLTVYATIAISAISEGGELSEHRAGFVGGVIKRWSVFDRDGSTTPVEPPADYANNGVFIVNCASVTFELVTAKAEAWAQANVFII